jgi:hypothetical protein
MAVSAEMPQGFRALTPEAQAAPMLSTSKLECGLDLCQHLEFLPRLQKVQVDASALGIGHVGGRIALVQQADGCEILAGQTMLQHPVEGVAAAGSCHLAHIQMGVDIDHGRRR